MESLDFVAGYVKRRSCPDVGAQIPVGHQFGRQSPRLNSRRKLSSINDNEEGGKRSGGGGGGGVGGSLDDPRGAVSMINVTTKRSPLEQLKHSNASMMKRLSIADNSVESQYKFLGNSGLKVSNICLSSIRFGTFPGGPTTNTNDVTSHALLDKFVEMGGNFIDTADTYPGMGTHSGYSESMIGRWLSSRDRHRIVIGSKCRYVTDPSCPNGAGLSRNHILWSLDQSLERLQTDYIDLYQIHGWDAGTPVEDTLRTLNDVVRSGKVRHIGAANLSSWQLEKFCAYAKFMGLEKMVTVQMNYNVADRGIEHEVLEVCREENVGLLSWNPLKDGLLTGKGAVTSEGDTINKDAFKTSDFPMEANRPTEKLKRISSLLESIADSKGKSMSQVALRWLIQQDAVSSVIVAASSAAELAPLMDAAKGWALTEEEMALIEEASKPEVTSYPLTMTSQQAGRRRMRFKVI